jgi:hypothetical protein
MLRTFARPTLCLLAAALALAGCRRDIEAESKAEREANATKVTADSTDDATAPIVDSDFGFRLTLPGAGWKLLRERDAASLNADAIAAAIHTVDGTCGIVMVERLPGTTLEQALELLWHEPLPDQVIESEQDLEFQGVPAKRRVFTAKVQGQTFHYVTTVFLHQDHLYQLMSWSLVGEQLQARLAFHEAFELLEGEVRGRSKAAREPLTHFDGVGWRIHDGRYESALAGLRLALPDGWRFIVGAELDQMQTDADIIVTNEHANMFVALTVERAPTGRLAALAELARQNFLDGQAPLGDPLPRQLAGQKVELRRYEQAPLGFLHGVYMGDDAITSVTAWYPHALYDNAIASIDAVLGELEALPASERASLHEQLLDTPKRQRRFHADRAFRAGEFVDFAHQLRWTMPSGMWLIESFDKALSQSSETVLSAAELELGVYLSVEAWSSEDHDPAATLAALIEGDELLASDTVVVDGLTLHRAQTLDHSQDPPMRLAFAITRRDDLMVSMMTSTVGDSPATRAAIQAAFDGLDFTPKLERTRVAGRTYTDLQHGFSFELPRGFEKPTLLRNEGLGQVSAWSNGNREIVSLVLTGGSDDEAWMSSFFEQVLRDVVGNTQSLGTPERSDGQLGPYPARQLTWTAGGTKLHAQVIVREPLVYCMLYGNLSDADREQVQRSWTLLE